MEAKPFNKPYKGEYGGKNPINRPDYPYSKMVVKEKEWHKANHFRNKEIKKKNKEYYDEYESKRPKKWQVVKNTNPYYAFH